MKLVLLILALLSFATIIDAKKLRHDGKYKYTTNINKFPKF